MEIPATVTGKGQVTIPASIRRALGLKAGGRVVCRLVGDRAVIQPEDAGEDTAPAVELEKAPNLVDPAGTVAVPPMSIRATGRHSLYEAGSDFADGYLIATAELADVPRIVSFDRRIRNLGHVRRVEP